MKHRIIAAACALAVAILFPPHAGAADLSLKTPYAPPVSGWTGFYIDAFLGGAINSTNETVTGAGFAADISGAPKGVVGGVEIGYDWQLSPQIVWGLFAEGALANINGGGNITANQFALLSANNDTNYLFAVGPRLGWLIDNTALLYAKGGFAAGGAHPDFTATVTQSIRDTSTGWMVGAGLQKMLAGGPWFIKLDYEHYQLGDRTLTIDLGGGNVMTNTAKYQIEVAKLGLGYRFP